MGIEEIARHFTEKGFPCVRDRRGYRGPCPAHGGKDRNLAISPSDRGGTFVTCWSHGCTEEEICRSVGLEVRDLYPPAKTNGRAGPGVARPVTRYRYNDEQGNLLFEVWRFEPKDFRPYHLDSSGQWKAGLPDGIRRVLYRLPELIAADLLEPVLIAAGEKDCDNLRQLGFVATTNPGGETPRWMNRPEWTEPLKGRYCVIVEDYDPLNPRTGKRPGEEHARQVLEALTAAGIRARRLLLPGLAEGEDASDWIQKGGTTEELRKLIEPPLHPLYLEIVNGLELQALKLPEPESLVPNLVYRGFSTLLAGDSKLGKSSLVLRMMLAMAAAGWWLDRDQRPEHRLPRSRVLYLNFEDPLYLTQQRALRMMGPDGIPTDFLCRPPPYGFTLGQIIEWLAEAVGKLRLDAVILDPIAIAAEWEKEEDNAKVALTFKALQRLAAETQVAVTSIHHVTKKAGQFGMNIRGASAIKANVMGYLVLDRDREGLRLSGINKLTGEWDVMLGRTEHDYSWWIERSISGHTRTPQQERKDAAKADLLGLVKAEPGVATSRLVLLSELTESTCRRYLKELEEADLVFGHEVPREPGQEGVAPRAWFPWASEGNGEVSFT